MLKHSFGYTLGYTFGYTLKKRNDTIGYTFGYTLLGILVLVPPPCLVLKNGIFRIFR